MSAEKKMLRVVIETEIEEAEEPILLICRNGNRLLMRGLAGMELEDMVDAVAKMYRVTYPDIDALMGEPEAEEGRDVS